MQEGPVRSAHQPTVIDINQPGIGVYMCYNTDADVQVGKHSLIYNVYINIYIRGLWLRIYVTAFIISRCCTTFS